MLKGKVYINNEEYNIMYDTDSAYYTRVDLYKGNYYNPQVTSDVIASYIDKKFVYTLGNRELVNQVVSLLIAADILNIDSSDIVDGFLVVRKSDKYITRETKFELTDTKVKYDCIESSEVKIVFDESETTTYSDSLPANINDYIKNQIIDESLDGDELIHSFEYLRTKFPSIDEINSRDYHIIDSEDAMFEALERIKKETEGLVGVDTETTGLAVSYMGNDYLTGVIISPRENVSFYFPFRQRKFKYNLPEWHIRTLFNFIRDLPKDVTVLAHNGVMEIKAFYKEVHDILRINRDTYCLSVLCNPSFGHGVHHDLKSEAELCDSTVYLELSDIFKNKKQIDFSCLPEDTTKVYACPDGDNVIKVYKRLIKYLPADEKGIFNLESQEIRVKAMNEYYGLRVNEKLLKDRLNTVIKQCKFIENLYYNSIGDFRKITSDVALRENIYKKLNAPVIVRTKASGLPATSKNAIAAILKKGIIPVDPNIKPVELDGEVLIKAEALSNKYQPLVYLQKFNLLEKERTSLERLVRTMSKGRIAFYINAMGAASGRQTSDAQQFSNSMKKVVLADSEQHDFYSCDYKQIEYRILISEAGETDLIEQAKDPDVDLHRLFSSRITTTPMYMISAGMRKKAKKVNFGIVYMMSNYGIAESLHGSAYTKEDLIDAQQTRTQFFNALPAIKKNMMDNENTIRTKGYVKTAFGRYRYDKEILDPDCPSWKKDAIVRKLNNTPIQGYGADLLKIVENKIFDWIHRKGWDKLVDCDGEMLPMVRMMLPIHDEILVSAHKSIPTEEILLMFRECFEIQVEGATKYYAAPALVNNWFDGKDDAYEIPIKYRDEILDEYELTHKSKINHDNWLSLLQNYREQEVKNWFESLKQKANGDFTILVSSVTHPVLTHTLISLTVDSEEADSLEHADVIKLATYKYLNGLGKKDSVDYSKLNLANYNTETIIDTEDDEMFEQETQVVDGVEYDENEEEVTIEQTSNNDKQEVKYKLRPEYSVDTVFLDITDFDINIDEIVDKIKVISHDNAWYIVNVLCGDKLKIAGKVNQGEIEELLKNNYGKECK